MAGVNKVILIGNLGRDPEMRHLDGGIARLNFSLATTESYRDKEGKRIEQTEWHNIVMWRAMAESAEKLLKKGMTIYLEGKLQTRNWNDKEGNKRQTTEIIGESFQILSKREQSGGTAGAQDAPANTSSSSDQSDSGDLPF